MAYLYVIVSGTLHLLVCMVFAIWKGVKLVTQSKLLPIAGYQSLRERSNVVQPGVHMAF